MRKLTIAILATGLLLGACKKDMNPPATPAEAASTADQPEQAYPGQQGELITLGSGKEEIVIEKINGQYIFQGDIVLTQEQFDYLKNGRKVVGEKNGRVGTFAFGKLWPNRVVPFTINSSMSATVRQRVNDAIAHWEANTNIDFVNRTSQGNWIEFKPGSGCSSSIGMVGGCQAITLDTDCSFGNAVHEIGHALGFYHEQSRVDRGNSIIINWNNIQSGKSHNFKTYAERGEEGFDLCAFDFGSIMLYSSMAFSKNNLPTITRLDGSTFGAQRTALSAGDIETYNFMYNPSVFMRMSMENIVQSDPSQWYIDYQTADFVIRLYSDQAGTIPVSFPCPIKVKIYQHEYHPNSFPSNWGYYFTVTVPANTNTLYLGNYVISDYRYGANGDPEGDSYSRSLSIAQAPGYRGIF